MEDLLEQNNNDYYFFYNSFTKINEELFFDEKGTSYSTINQHNYENNDPCLNELPNPFLYSHNENEDYEDDKENYYLNKKTNRNDDIKHEIKTSSNDNNNKAFITEKKLSKNEVLKNINNINIKDNVKLKDKGSKIDKLSNCGRKNKESGETGKHNKNCEDNIINKIKTNIFSDFRMISNNFLQKRIFYN